MYTVPERTGAVTRQSVMRCRERFLRELRTSTRWGGWVAGAVLVTLVAAGCGNDSAQPRTDPTTETTSEPSQPPDSTAAPATEVEAISLIRRGGLAGGEETWRLRPGDDASERAFRLATRRSIIRAEIADVVKQPPACCDFFVYYLTLRYADGTALRAVMSEEQAPRVLSELVSAVTSTRSTGTEGAPR